jgi:membrane protein YqaA with SNARE-associated domain
MRGLASGTVSALLSPEMARIVESPDQVAEALPDERPAATPRQEPTTCEEVLASPELDAAVVADETGANLVADPPTPPARRWPALLGVIVGIAVLGGLSTGFLFFPIDWQAVGSWGYLGIFGVVLVATASVALPIPYLLIVARAGTFLDPFAIAGVAGLAGVLGELTGYLIGVGGSGLIPHGRWYERARLWICRYGFWCVAFFACVPNPFFDAMGLAAGTLRYSWWRFALACFLGKTIKFLIAALIGVEVAQRGWQFGLGG